MQKDEASKIVLKLAALFPNTDVKKETIALWIEYFLPLDAPVMRQAVNDYALTPGKKFFPTPGELLEYYDRIYQQILSQKTESDRQAERDATKLLFQKPINSFRDDYVKKSVQLIRDVCNGEIKYKSPEWNERFEGIYGKTHIGWSGTH